MGGDFKPVDGFVGGAEDMEVRELLISHFEVWGSCSRI
jgi:hypothetical protein